MVAEQLPLQLGWEIETGSPPLKEKWEQVQTLLRETVRRSSYEAFLRNLRPAFWEEGCLVISAPSNIVRQFVEKNYLGPLQTAVNEVFGQEVKIQVIVQPLLEKEGKKPSPPRVSEAAQILPGSLPLNPRYTFETFVVGKSNRLAHAGALAVATSTGTSYNPLFIYGGVGLGKTHLLQAIAHASLRAFPDRRVMYLSGESFTIQYVTALQQRKMEEFRRRCRCADLLLIDDIQFIANKESTEEEFFHTFNTLYETGKQIVLASDRPPKDLLISSPRLRSRFEAGLLADVAPPDLEMRIAILKEKARQENVELPEEVVEYVASLVASNIRVLEGALIKLLAYASISGCLITRSVVDQVLGPYFRAPQENEVTPARVLECVSRKTCVSVEQMKGKRRDRSIVLARQIAMYLLREFTPQSLPEIGALFGGRDHSAVIHSCSKIRERMRKEPEVRQLVEELIQEIRGHTE